MKAFLNTINTFLKTADDFFGKIEKGALIIILSTVIGLSFLQVVLRNLFFGGWTWVDVFLRHMVLWLGLIGASIATKENRHISIDIIPRVVRSKTKFVINILIGFISIYVCSILFKASISFVEAEKSFGTTVFKDFPVWIFQIIFPVAFFIIAYRFVLNVLNSLRDLIK